MNQFQQQSGIFLIEGYFMPSPRKPGTVEEHFEDARTECLKHLRQQIEHVEAITAGQFFTATGRAEISSADSVHEAGLTEADLIGGES